MTPDFIGEPGYKKLFIELFKGHYNTITSITGYFNTSYFCESCLVGFKGINLHKCKNGCNQCHGPLVCFGKLIRCQHCGRDFNGYDCFLNHKQNKICERTTRCTQCLVEYREPQQHTCGIYHCIICKEEYTVSPHYCCISKLDLDKLKKEDEENKIICCFDIECMLEQDGEFQIHKPVLLIAQTVCKKCFNFQTWSKVDCVICGSLTSIFKGEDCVTNFGDFLYKQLA